MTLHVRSDTVAEMVVRDFAEVGSQAIVRQGGGMVETSAGVSCYPARIDARIPIEVFDPQRGCCRCVIARVRLTVEMPER